MDAKREIKEDQIIFYTAGDKKNNRYVPPGGHERNYKNKVQLQK